MSTKAKEVGNLLAEVAAYTMV